MALNVLVLPLLGGYLVVSKWRLTSYKVGRYPGQWLLFTAAWYGLWLLLIAIAINHIVSDWYVAEVAEARNLNLSLEPNAAMWLHGLIFRVCGGLTDFLSGGLILGKPIQYLGTSVLALLLAFPARWLLNRWYPEKRTSRRIVEEEGDPFEKMLEEAISRDEYVCVSLLNGKVYIGHVMSNFDPKQERRFFSLLPHMSGVRLGDEKRLSITEVYQDVINSVADGKEREGVDVDDFRKVIPLHAVQTINLFDLDVFGLFERPSPVILSLE